jgi:hypothetical protein
MTRTSILETGSGLLEVLSILFSKEICQKLGIALLSAREEDLTGYPQNRK